MSTCSWSEPASWISLQGGQAGCEQPRQPSTDLGAHTQAAFLLWRGLGRHSQTGPHLPAGEGPYRRKCSFHTGFRVLLLTSVTWTHLVGGGLLCLLLFRGLERCSLGLACWARVPEAGTMPSMQ